MSGRKINSDPSAPDLSSSEWADIRWRETNQAWKNLVGSDFPRLSDQEKVLRAVVCTFDNDEQAVEILMSFVRLVGQGLLSKKKIQAPGPEEAEEPLAVATMIINVSQAGHDAEYEATLADWRFAWKKREEPGFLVENAGKHFMVFQGQIVGTGEEEEDAYADARQRLGREIPHERRVIDYVEKLAE